MEEKIKFTISKKTYNTIIQDCENFDFLKNEKEINRNLFYNTLIKNYYEQFNQIEIKLKEELLKQIDKYKIPDPDQFIDNILSTIIKKPVLKEEDSVIINLKPTKLSEQAIYFIHENLLKNTSISSYYRKLFESYTNLLQSDRERILYQDIYHELVESITNNTRVTILLKDGKKIKDTSIFIVEASKEKLFNYVLMFSDESPLTLRLAKIKTVIPSLKERIIPKNIQKILEKQVTLGIQYPIYSLKESQVLVKLTVNGQKLFKKLSTFRPTPIKIENDIYYFNCSHSQIIYYFKFFGPQALILSPKKLANHFLKFYHQSDQKYQIIMADWQDDGTLSLLEY